MLFRSTAARGIVLKQLPDANSTVKINRTVYLTVNRVTPPVIIMPSLEGKSLRFALELLRRSHLTLGDTVFRPDFMKGSVIEQQFAGARILPGAKLKWGSKIDLVIGSGLDDANLLVPDLWSGIFIKEFMRLRDVSLVRIKLFSGIFLSEEIIKAVMLSKLR